MTPSLKLHLFPIQILPTKEKGRLACTKSCHIIISHSRWARKWLDQKLSNTAEILQLEPDFPWWFLRYAMQLKLGRGCYLDYIVIIIIRYSIIYTYRLVESRSVSSWLYSPWGCPARRGCRWCEVSGRGTLSTHYLRRRMEAASYGEYRVVVAHNLFQITAPSDRSGELPWQVLGPP